MDDRPWAGIAIEDRVRVAPHPDGYQVIILGTDIEFMVTHEEIKGQNFDCGAILDREWEWWFGVEELEQRPREWAPNGLVLGLRAAQPVKEKVPGFRRKQPRKPSTYQEQVDAVDSMADFISTRLVDQLRLKREILAKPVTVQLAVHGSCSQINASTAVNLKYQNIDCERRFDIANLDSYDAILGTPFVFQHKVACARDESYQDSNRFRYSDGNAGSPWRLSVRFLLGSPRERRATP
jgi:hypothetical protein